MKKLLSFKKKITAVIRIQRIMGMVNNITARIRLMEELNYSKQEIRDYR